MTQSHHCLHSLLLHSGFGVSMPFSVRLLLAVVTSIGTMTVSVDWTLCVNPCYVIVVMVTVVVVTKGRCMERFVRRAGMYAWLCGPHLLQLL